ncbi:MAG: hypothetical protein EPO28_09910, partial [Saprospiraceae bacterium]
MVPLFLGVFGTVSALTINWEDASLSGTANEKVAQVFEKASFETLTAPAEMLPLAAVSISSVDACIIGSDISFSVTFANWPTTGGPWDIGLLYSRDPSGTSLISVSGVPDDPSGTITVCFGPVADALDPGTVAISSITQTASPFNPPPDGISGTAVPYTGAPALTTPAADMTVECDGAGNAASLAAWLASGGGATTCSAVTWSNDFVALSDLCGATGSAFVTFTATDGCGNTFTTSATFTIVDMTNPSITCPSDATVECDAVPASDFFGGSSSDICSGTATVTFISDTPAGPYSACTTTVLRVYEAADDCGNTAQCTQTITVEDTTNPSITCPSDATVECDAVPASDFSGGSSSDNCAATAPVTFISDTPA